MATNTAAIQALYVAYFNRPADPIGLAFWENAMEKHGATLATISAQFAKEAEYKAVYDGLSISQTVTQIYLNLFGREPEVEGLKFWSQALAANVITIDNMVTAVAAGAQGSDKVAYENKAKAAVAFTAALDTTTEINAYSGTAALAAGKAFISSVTTTASYDAAVQPATLNATISNVVVVGNADAAAVVAAKAAYDTAATATATALATATTKNADATAAATAVTDALAARDSAITAAAATDAAALKVTSDAAAVTAATAVTDKATADAAVVTAQTNLTAAIASGVAIDVATAQGQLIIEIGRAHV